MTNCDFDTTQKSKPSYDIENGKLVIRSWLGTIKTGIGARWGDDEKNYIITTNAYDVLPKYLKE